MVEKFQEVPPGVVQKVEEEPMICICPGDHWEELRPKSDSPFSDATFVLKIRHEFLNKHVRNGVEVGGIEPTEENVFKHANPVWFTEHGLWRGFRSSSFRSVKEIFEVAFVQELEQERQQRRLDVIQAVPEEGRVLSVLESRLEPLTPHKREQVEKAREKMRQLDLAAIARGKAGDKEAFGEIYDRYVDRVYRQIYYRTGSKEVVEDLVAQVFVNAYQAIGRYKDTGRPFVVWLLRIAHNLLTDYYRAKRETTNIDDVVISDVNPENDPTAVVERRFESEVLKKAISKLKPDQGLVVMMRYIDGMKYSEIAAILKKKEGAVRIILFRALLALRGIMGAEEVPVSQEQERKIKDEPSEKRFSYSDLAEILGMNLGTLKQRILTAEKHGQLELSPSPSPGGGRGKRRFTREDVAVILEYLGEDPSLVLQYEAQPAGSPHEHGKVAPISVAGVIFAPDKPRPRKPKQPSSLYPIVLGKPWEEKPQVQKKPKEEAKRIAMVGDGVARVLGEILLFKANWQYLGQALARHGVKIDERQYQELQSSHKIFTETMKSDGADNQALILLTEKIIPNLASADGQRKAIIDAQKSDYARFLFNILEPLPKEELLKVFEEMRFQFVTAPRL